MLVLHRRYGQGLVVKNDKTLEEFDIDYMYTKGGAALLRVNEKEMLKKIGEPFYLDKSEEVMIISMFKDMSFRIAIGAPKCWNIRRKEVPEE